MCSPWKTSYICLYCIHPNGTTHYLTLAKLCFPLSLEFPISIVGVMTRKSSSLLPQVPQEQLSVEFIAPSCSLSECPIFVNSSTIT